MAPEVLKTMEENLLVDLAKKIEAYQKAENLSTEALVKKVPQVGSSKTYGRILKADFAELDLERQLVNYQTAVAWIESAGNDHAPDEDLHDDLTPVLAVRRAFLATQKEKGNARVIFVLGPSGSGKSSARRAVMDKFGSRLILIEATVAWSDSPNAMLAAILRALGKRDIPLNGPERLDKVVDLLGEKRLCVIVEESHHLGPRCLNLVKTLVNQTPGEFMLIGIDTLWQRLETKAFEEARQLTGNRLAERIQLGRDIKERDVKILIERRAALAEPEDRTLVLKSLLHYAPNYGRFAFIRDVITRVVDLAGTTPATREHYMAAIAEEIKSR